MNRARIDEADDRLTVETIVEIQRRYAEGEEPEAISAALRVSVAKVARVLVSDREDGRKMKRTRPGWRPASYVKVGGMTGRRA